METLLEIAKRLQIKPNPAITKEEFIEINNRIKALIGGPAWASLPYSLYQRRKKIQQNWNEEVVRKNIVFFKTMTLPPGIVAHGQEQPLSNDINDDAIFIWHNARPRNKPLVERFVASIQLDNPDLPNLYEKLDNFIKKYQAGYKITDIEHADRTDTLNLYMTQPITPKIAREFYDIVKPFLKESNHEFLDGFSIKNASQEILGIKYGPEPCLWNEVRENDLSKPDPIYNNIKDRLNELPPVFQTFFGISDIKEAGSLGQVCTNIQYLDLLYYLAGKEGQNPFQLGNQYGLPLDAGFPQRVARKYTKEIDISSVQQKDENVVEKESFPKPENSDANPQKKNIKNSEVSQIEEIAELVYKDGMTEQEFFQQVYAELRLRNLMTTKKISRDQAKQYKEKRGGKLVVCPYEEEWTKGLYIDNIFINQPVQKRKDPANVYNILDHSYYYRRFLNFPDYTHDEKQRMSKVLTETPDVYVDEQGAGYFSFRILKGWKKPGHSLARFQINADMNPKMIEDLDNFMKRHNCVYKTPTPDEWAGRTDTVNIYMYEPATDDIKNEIVKIMTPYIRKSDPSRVNSIDGELLADGIGFAKEASPQNIQSLINKFPPHLQEKAECYLGKRTSLGMVRVAEEFLDMYKKYAPKFKENSLESKKTTEKLVEQTQKEELSDSVEQKTASHSDAEAQKAPKKKEKTTKLSQEGKRPVVYPQKASSPKPTTSSLNTEHEPVLEPDNPDIQEEKTERIQKQAVVAPTQQMGKKAPPQKPVTFPHTQKTIDVPKKRTQPTINNIQNPKHIPPVILPQDDGESTPAMIQGLNNQGGIVINNNLSNIGNPTVNVSGATTGAINISNVGNVTQKNVGNATIGNRSSGLKRRLRKGANTDNSVRKKPAHRR